MGSPAGNVQHLDLVKPGTETLGFQSPTTVLGFLPGIEYVATEKWSFSGGCAFDTIGKFGGHKVTPALTAYYSF